MGAVNAQLTLDTATREILATATPEEITQAAQSVREDVVSRIRLGVRGQFLAALRLSFHEDLWVDWRCDCGQTSRTHFQPNGHPTHSQVCRWCAAPAAPTTLLGARLLVRLMLAYNRQALTYDQALELLKEPNVWETLDDAHLARQVKPLL